MLEFLATMGVVIGSLMVTIILASIFGAVEEAVERRIKDGHSD